MAAADTSKLPEAPHPAAVMVQLQGSKSKEELKAVQVSEKVVLPDLETINKEKAEVELRKSIESAGDNRKSLHHVEPQEKIILPSLDDVKREKTENALRDEIHSKDSKRLSHVETQEKNTLPNKETIEEEKKAQ